MKKQFDFKLFPRFAIIKIIRFYQKTLSFDHGFLKFLFPSGYCRFRPTCSEYAVEAIEKYGTIKGGLKTIWRILRCNPWNKGGWDPIKQETRNKLQVPNNFQ